MPPTSGGVREGAPLPRAASAVAPRDAPSDTWCCLVEPAGRAGAENMAADEALLEEAARTGRAFLRLYRFAPPCLSFGRNEPAIRRYDRTMIERLGLDVVRRPTGGRAVWHEHEVTYAVAAPASGLLDAHYRAIHTRLAIALRRLGVAATLTPPARPRALGAGACFDASVGGELVVGGRKVVGSAQLRRGGAFLQHGSILLDGSQALVRRVSREHGAAAGESTLSGVLGRAVTFAEVAAVVAMAFGCALETDAALPVAVAPGSERLAAHAARFSDPTWTWRR